MRRTRLTTLAACIFLLCGPAAGAEQTVKVFLQGMDEPTSHELAAVWLLGASKGFLQANIFLTTARNEAPLYCPPSQLDLTEDQLVSMLRQAVVSDPLMNDKAVPEVLLDVLQKTFPCNAAGK